LTTLGVVAVIIGSVSALLVIANALTERPLGAFSAACVTAGMIVLAVREWRGRAEKPPHR
jgi:hypothetical protein